MVCSAPNPTRRTTIQSALIYVRVSTNRQEDEGTSLDSQQEACREKAEELNVPIAKVYREVSPNQVLK